VFVEGVGSASAVTFVWGRQERPRLLMTQMRGRFHFEKVVHESDVVRTKVNGANAAWIEGRPHVLFVETEDGVGRALEGRLAGNTLVWSRGPVTLRLEGRLDRDEAERIARSVR
jgi:hypothetical protein